MSLHPSPKMQCGWVGSVQGTAVDADGSPSRPFPPLRAPIPNSGLPCCHSFLQPVAWPLPVATWSCPAIYLLPFPTADRSLPSRQDKLQFELPSPPGVRLKGAPVTPCPHWASPDPQPILLPPLGSSCHSFTPLGTLPSAHGMCCLYLCF